MKLDEVALTNFRCFRNETVSLSPYTAIIGPNNSGKSTVFKAVDLFFKSTQKTNPFVPSDFNDPSKPLKIELSFSGLPEKGEAEFGHYYRHGKLNFFIRATTDGSRVDATIHGQRLGIKAFSGFFDASSATEKKNFYAALLEQFPDLPNVSARSAVSIFESALREYEASHQNLHELIESEDLAFGGAGVAARLRKFVDWVYIPAVKDAADEDEEAKNTAFGVLINRIIRAKVQVDEKVALIQAVAHDQIISLVGDYKEEVAKLETVLDQEFRKITSTDAHVHLDWTDVGADSVSLNLPLVRSVLSDETFKGEISRFGHGLQRNYLMTLVHLNAKLALEEQPSIILAVEEPELYQHPPQARYLNSALRKISESDQVLITTHSPYFVSAKGFDDIRVVRKSNTKLSTINAWSVDEHRALISGALGEPAIGQAAAVAKLDVFIQPELNESFFCGRLVLVEGLEDRAALIASLSSMDVYDEFLRLGGHIVGVNGKGNLINMVSIARGFLTPYFLMFDADTNCKTEAINGNKKLNRTLAALAQLAVADVEWPEQNIFHERAIVWKTNLQGAIAEQHNTWIDEVKTVCTTWGWQYDRLDKNPSVIGHCVENLFSAHVAPQCLQKAVATIMAFAKSG